MKFKKSVFFAGVVLVLAFLFVRLLYHQNLTKDVTQNNSAFLQSLNSHTEFQNFAGPPLDNSYPGISSVKVIYDLNRKQIFYINSHLFSLHYDFCNQVLGYKLDLRIFNATNYSSSRQYYLANINHLAKSGHYVLEFNSDDEIDSLQILEMYAKVRESLFVKNKLQLLLNSTNIIRYFSGHTSIPVCNLTALSNGLSYQAIQAGSCTGKLMLCDNLKKQYLSISPNDIIIVKGTPTEVPICKAVISDCFQTPLSHIQVLSHNKKMPSAYLQNVFSNDSILKYDGKIVELVVSADTLFIKPASVNRVTGKPVQKILLPLNITIKSVIPLEECAGLGNADIGAKAKGLSDLKIISQDHRNLFHIPEGAFVIPFYFYRQHLRNSGVDPLLLSLKQCGPDEAKKTDSLLSCIRKAINNTAISTELLAMVHNQVVKNKCGDTYRFRSSGNAEDLPDFSGAGLYDSKTGQLNNAKKSIEKAIKKVWASMYNYRAYRERYFAGIDENTAAMSILAHRNFPDEDINGVIITKNIYRDDYPSIVVNAQKGDVSTVSPPDSVKCEQLILTENKLLNPFSKKVSAKYICYSSLHPQGTLLSYEQLLLLQKSTSAITAYLASKKQNWDLEFKFEGNKLYFKQVRPYR